MKLEKKSFREHRVFIRILHQHTKSQNIKRLFCLLAKINLKITIFDFRCTLKEEEVKRRNDLLHEKTKDQFKEKEREYDNEDQVRKQPETSVGTLGTGVKTARNEFSEVSEPSVKSQILPVFHQRYL